MRTTVLLITLLGCGSVMPFTCSRKKAASSVNTPVVKPDTRVVLFGPAVVKISAQTKTA